MITDISWRWNNELCTGFQDFCRNSIVGIWIRRFLRWIIFLNFLIDVHLNLILSKGVLKVWCKYSTGWLISKFHILSFLSLTLTAVDIKQSFRELDIIWQSLIIFSSITKVCNSSCTFLLLLMDFTVFHVILICSQM